MPSTLERLESLEEGFLGIIEKGIEGLRDKSIGVRDFTNLLGYFKKIREENKTRSEEWFDNLRTLKKASESIEELCFNNSPEVDKTLFFDIDGSKKKIFQAA